MRTAYIQIPKTIIGFTLSVLVAVSCVTDANRNGDTEEPVKDIVPYTEGNRIAWDYQTLTRVYDGRVFYPRIIRLQNGDLLCAFESSGEVYLTRSTNEGRNWQQAELTAPRDGDVISATPELIQLENGRIILAYNPRPPGDNQNPENHFGIKVRTSDDGGFTWSDEINVFEAGQTGSRGVWEPAMIQLESGEIQLFFANQYPYVNSNDQEISMVRSTDNGESWTEPETISYRPGHRDGMPVPLILQDDKGIAVAIEDNGMNSNQFKPAIIWNPDGNWPGTAGANSDRRWRALTGSDQLTSADYGGAPYLRQLPTGETVLSFQSTEDRSGGWTKSTMAVAIGDDEAKNFSRKSKPFEVPEGRSALWSSLFIKNDTTVTAVTSTTAFNEHRRELYIKDGYVQREMYAPQGTVNIDGELDDEVWKTSSKNFLGAKSPANTRVAAAWDDDHLYLGFSVFDPSLTESPDRPANISDAVAVMLAPDLVSNDAIVSGTYKIFGTAFGEVSTRVGDEGSWTDEEFTVEAAAKINDNNDQNYQLELAIPWGQVGGKPDPDEGWGINFELINYNSSTNKTTREEMSGSDGYKPSTWLKIQLIP